MRIQEFLKGIFATAEYGNSANFAVNSRSCRQIHVKLFGEVGRLICNKLFDFAADTEHGRGLRILK